MIEDEQFIAVGDIHGCLVQLEEILEAVRAYPNHKLVFLGDYIDRGPDSEGVLRRLNTVDAVFLLGNHDEPATHPDIVLKDGWYGYPLHNTRISMASIQWLRTVPLITYETPSYLFVHGGLDPQKPYNAQTNDDYLWSRYRGDYSHLTRRTVVHGHTVVDQPEVVGNRLNINTGCGAGGPLTAVVLPQMRFLTSSRS